MKTPPFDPAPAIYGLVGAFGVLVNTNFEIVGPTWSVPNSDYATQLTGWLNGLHCRLKLQTATEAVIGRTP